MHRHRLIFRCFQTSPPDSVSEPDRFLQFHMRKKGHKASPGKFEPGGTVRTFSRLFESLLCLQFSWATADHPLGRTWSHESENGVSSEPATIWASDCNEDCNVLAPSPCITHRHKLVDLQDGMSHQMHCKTDLLIAAGSTEQGS